MDILKDKQTKSYPNISRYAVLNYYYNTVDNKFIYEVWRHLGKDINYVVHEITPEDTLDTLALFYYGRPDLYWCIADFNDIIDPYIGLFGKYKTLNIPTLSDIYFKED